LNRFYNAESSISDDLDILEEEKELIA